MEPKKSPVHFGSPLCTEVIACLEEAFQLLETDQAERLNADPYYERSKGRPPLTDADVDRMIEALDEEFGSEIDRFPDYHKRRSGATRKTDWFRLTPSQRRGLANRVDAIIARYE
jgi:hypothetical protein